MTTDGQSLRRYHMGCGDKRLPGYVNVDVRDTAAADLVRDLNEPELEPRSAEAVFSHAFFEHLLRDKREPHLRAVKQALDPDNGFVCYLGLPDFRAVARLYLEGGPGIVGPDFDLYNVYRYTHGDPEGAEGYFEQLHKSLFDAEEVDRLLTGAGYPSYAIFGYVYPGEPAPVSLGFYATRTRKPPEVLRESCRGFLAPFAGELVEIDTVEFELGRARAPAHAGYLATSIDARRRFRRGASRALARLRERRQRQR
jgi:predicted SAM-dependent methyltransferase